MKLRGTEPVEFIDLSDKRLTELSAIIIASLIGSNTATKSLKFVAARFPATVSSPCHLIALPRAASTVPSLLPFSISPFCSPIPLLASLRCIATTFWMPPCSLSTLLDASALAFQPFWMHPCPLSYTSAHSLLAMSPTVLRRF